MQSDFACHILFIGRAHELSPHLLADTGELLEVPPRYLDHTVVETGLKAGCGGVGNRVAKLWQGSAQGQLGCHVSQGVACGLGGQG